MPDYSVFGGCLRSDLPFSELRPAQVTQPDWTLRISPAPLSAAESAPLGIDTVDGPVQVRLFRSPDGFRLSYDDTGCFVVSRNGAQIVWHPAPEASASAARLDVLGRVLALCAHAAGGLCLHGSAVSFAAGGIALLAPKYHGKSTLAHALVSAGALLATDDALPVEIGPPVRMRPGVHRIRLWRDSAEQLGAEVPGGDPDSPEKRNLDDIPADRLMSSPAPLRAIYLLAPVRSEAGAEAVERASLSSVPAALSLVRHATLGPLLGGSESAVLLERAAAVARSVPVFALRVARDFDRLPRVVERLMEWHGAEMHETAGTPG